MALKAAQAGHRAVLAARRRSAVQDLAREYGPDSLMAVAHVTDAQAVEALLESAVRRFGKVDVRVKCAVVASVG